VSCGIDGAVYEWDVASKQRCSECVLKSCNYTCSVISPEGDAIYAVGSDRTLKEIRDNVVQQDVPTKNGTSPEVVLTQVALSHSGRMLVAGTAQGAVRAYKFPLSEPGEWTALASHVGPVSRIRISMDDQYMFTVGEDGCLFVYNLSDKEGRGSRRDPATGFAEEVLIGRADLAEKNALMNEVKKMLRGGVGERCGAHVSAAREIMRAVVATGFPALPLHQLTVSLALAITSPT
jgi:WD40 repeat protein